MVTAWEDKLSLPAMCRKRNGVVEMRFLLVGLSEWLGKGLQNLVREFDSRTLLENQKQTKMKRVLKFMKKAVKWYFEHNAKNYTWLTTGTTKNW